MDCPELLGRLLFPAEFQQRLAMRLPGWHPGGDVLLLEFLDMEPEFAVEFALQGLFALNPLRKIHWKLLFRCRQNQADCAAEPLPALLFLCQLFAAFGRELVELCLASVLRLAPCRFEPSTFLQPVQCGIE